MSRFILLTCILILCNARQSFGLTGWSSVDPALQQLSLNDTEAPIEFGATIRIRYLGDSLEWTANELQRQLEFKLLGIGIIGYTVVVESVTLEKCNITHGPFEFCPPDGIPTIVLGSWDHLESAFALSQRVEFTIPPGADGNSEEYYIWSTTPEEVPGFDYTLGPDVRMAVSAATIRGFNYAATSIWQGCLASASEGLRWQRASIIDYPTFPSRLVAHFQALGSNPNYGYGGRTWQQDLADSLLRLQRDVLLYSKANGIIHAGKAREYDGLNSSSANVLDVMEHLGTAGRDDGLGFDGDKWGDMRFDWYEGFSWELLEHTPPANNKNLLYRRIPVKSTCAVIPGGNESEIVVVPAKPDSFFSRANHVNNHNFHSYTPSNQNPSKFRGWNIGATTDAALDALEINRVSDSPAWGCRIANIDIGAYAQLNTFLNVIALDPNSGSQNPNMSPARQMILSFSLRSTTANYVRPEVFLRLGYHLQLDGAMNPAPSSPTEVEAFELLHLDSVGHPNSSWTKHEILFNTLDARWAQLYFRFHNESNSFADIEIDSVYISDAPFVDIVGVNDPNYSAHVMIKRGTTIVNANAESYLTFAERVPNGVTWDDWRIHDAEATLHNTAWGTYAPPQSTDIVEIEYFVGAKTAILLSYTNGIIDYSEPWTQRREIRTDSPSEFTDLMHDQMQWFETSFAAEGLGPYLSGFHCIENEFKQAGYMPAETDGGTGQENWGNFLQTMYDALPIPASWPAEVQRPIYVWGDMFNPYHNGTRFSRNVNPYLPILGYSNSAGEGQIEIPGISEGQPFNFIEWEIHRGINPDEHVEQNVSYWSGLTTANDSFRALLGFGVDQGTQGPFDFTNDESRLYYKGLVDMAEAKNEDGAKHAGGFLFYWPERELASGNYVNANHKYYYPAFESGFDSAKGEWLEWLWNSNPVLHPITPFSIAYDDAISSASAVFKAYEIPYHPDYIDMSVDSVVLQSRVNGASWTTSMVTNQSDSLYDFVMGLPDSGGKVEYRMWAFEKFGTYGSYPGRGTKWIDPNAGERNYFTFERRKDDAIVKPDTFWLPGVITKEHQVAPNGKLVFQPLPGYKHATLYVGDDAKVTTTWTGTGNARPEIKFNGTDTSYIHVKPLCDTCTWKGIFDSVGVMVKNFVTFHEGTGEALVLKNATGDSKAQFNEAAFEDTVLVKGPTEITGSATFNKLIVENGATLTILPGSALSFFESGQLIVKKGGMLKAFGNDSTEIVFKAAVDSLRWEGIHCESDSQMAACSLKYVDISGAVAGVLLDRSRGYAEHCVFHDNLYGALVNNGAWLEAVACSVSTNEVGIAATNLSTVELLDVVTNYNAGPGLKGLSRSSFYLEDCFVNDNGGDGVAGGIGLYTGSNLFMECTEVAANTGSGITAYGGTIMLTSVKTVGDTLWQWQGNRIEHNATIPYEGQITLRDRTALALWNGNNCLWDTTGDGKLIHWEDQVGTDRWADVYWGSTDTASIKSKLPSNVTLVRIDSSRTLCPTFTADNSVHDSLVQIFLLPHNAELSGQYTRADSGYKAMIRNSQSSDYALSAVDRLLSVNLAQNKAFGPVRDTLTTLYNNVASLSLKRWIKEGQAWCWAELDDSTNAAKILDSLAQNTPTRFDRVAARAQKQMLSVRLLRVPSAEYKASDCIAYLDSAQKALEVMKVWTQTSITDSVVMYAPATVEGEITVAQPNGRLTILPHPGAEDPTIRFRGAGSILVQGWDLNYPPAKMYIQGEPENRVRLEWDSTTVWVNIESRRANIYMNNADLIGKGWVNWNVEIISGGRSPVFYADSCTFVGFEDGLWIHGLIDSCTVSNCRFESMGGNADNYSGQGSGMTVVYSDGVTIENCQFEDNDRLGIWGYECTDLSLNEVSVTGSGDYGFWAWNADATINCGTYSDNGDTLPEIWVEDGTVNLVSGNTLISDSSGVLIQTGHPSYTDIEDGQNMLQLLGQSGNYLKSLDTSSVWDITYNAWAPLDPADSGFFAKLYPSNPAKWTVDSSLAQFIECGGGSGSSTGPHDLIVVTEDGIDGTFSTEASTKSESVPPLDKSASLAKRTTSKASTLAQHHSELIQWREFRDLARTSGSKSSAIAMGKRFIDENPSSPLVPATVVQLVGLAKQDKGKHAVSAFLAQHALETKDKGLQALMQRKSCVALAFEGNVAAALRGLEDLIESSPTTRDSLCALADATGLYWASKSTHDLSPKYSFVRTESIREFKDRMRELARFLDSPTFSAEPESSPIPTSYALYQNYPNPFNPNTEIRFDLPEAIHAELKVFNILGQEVVTLVDDVRAAGAYRVLWDGKNAAGLTVASGVYIYQIKTPNFTDAKKMMLIR